MDDLSKLKEAISEELFRKEPLALAIILYLQKQDPAAYSKIVNQFDEVVGHNLEKLIKKHCSEDDLDE